MFVAGCLCILLAFVIWVTFFDNGGGGDGYV